MPSMTDLPPNDNIPTAGVSYRWVPGPRFEEGQEEVMRALFVVVLLSAVGCGRSEPTATSDPPAPVPPASPKPPAPEPAPLTFERAWAAAVKRSEVFDQDEPGITAKELARKSPSDRRRAENLMREADKKGTSRIGSLQLLKLGFGEWVQARCQQAARGDPNYKAVMAAFYPTWRPEEAGERIYSRMVPWAELTEAEQRDTRAAVERGDRNPPERLRRIILIIGGREWLDAGDAEPGETVAPPPKKGGKKK